MTVKRFITNQGRDAMSGPTIIVGGVEGGRRLEVLARVFAPTTATLLADAGLVPGMACLDLGCGVGSVSLLLADLVGPTGRVVGVDIDAVKVGLARRAATDAGRANVEFRLADARGPTDAGSFDLVYARFLLSHLPDPAAMLRSMRAAARPGGLCVVEDVDFAGSFCYPPHAAYDWSVRLYRETAARRGADADLGPKLPALLRAAGWRDVSVRVVQPVFAAGEGKLLAALTLAGIAAAAQEAGLTDEDAVRSAVAEMTRFADDPETLVATPRVFQTWGRNG